MTPFHKLHGMTRRRKVHEYMVWRAGQSVDWQCSIVDLSRETGLDVATVRSILSSRGWMPQIDGRADNAGPGGRPPLDTLMRYGIDHRVTGRERF